MNPNPTTPPPELPWLPIDERTPRDGTEIELKSERHPSPQTPFICWFEKAEYCWRFNDGTERSDGVLASWPTHWRPLHPSPVAQTEGEKPIDPEGLKGGPGAQAKLREYFGKFRVAGDNPPMVVAENGDAILSMMWPVHEQTPEGEKAAVEYTAKLAAKIADLLNQHATPPPESPLVGEQGTPRTDDRWTHAYGKGTWSDIAQDMRDWAGTLETELANLTRRLAEAEREREGAIETVKKIKEAHQSYIFRIRDMLGMKTPGDGFVTFLDALKTERDSLRTSLATANAKLGEAEKNLARILPTLEKIDVVRMTAQRFPFDTLAENLGRDLMLLKELL